MWDLLTKKEEEEKKKNKKKDEKRMKRLESSVLTHTTDQTMESKAADGLNLARAIQQKNTTTSKKMANINEPEDALIWRIRVSLEAFTEGAGTAGCPLSAAKPV
jgi:hypothetical protein